MDIKLFVDNDGVYTCIHMPAFLQRGYSESWIGCDKVYGTLYHAKIHNMFINLKHVVYGGTNAHWAYTGKQRKLLLKFQKVFSLKTDRRARLLYEDVVIICIIKT